MTPGQIAVLSGWLSSFQPTDTYVSGEVSVLTTDMIISDLTLMADFELNEVADYMAEQGYKFCPCIEGIESSGWLLKDA